MAHEIGKMIFDNNYNAKPVSKNAYQLVYEFIELNSGSITVESKEGEGTTFALLLPLFSSNKSPIEKLNMRF